MFLINAKQIEGGTAFSGACLYRLTTKAKTNVHGDWFMFEVSDAGWVEDIEVYERGLALNAAFEEGSKSVEADEVPPAETGDPQSAAM